MARFQIETPEGKFEVEAPDESTAIAALGIKPKPPEKNETLNTARILGTAAIQGVTDVANIPSSIVGMAGPLSSLQQGAVDWLRRQVGATPRPEGFGKAIAEREGRIGSVASNILNVSPKLEAIGVPTDAAKEAERLGAEMTPLRKSLASAVRTGTGALTLGAGPAGALMSGAGAGAGQAIGGDTGEIIGAFAGPMLATGAVNKIKNAMVRKEFIKTAPAVASERSASERLSQALKTTYQAEKGMVTPDIEAAKKALRSAKMPTNVVKGYSDKYLASVGPVEASQIPTNLLEKGMTGKVTNFREVDNALSIIKATARDLPAADPRRVAIEKYVAHMMDLAPYKKPGVGPAYSQYAQFKREFGDKDFGQLFRRNPDRTWKVPPSEAGETVSRLPFEGVEKLRQYPNIRAAMNEYAHAQRVGIIQKAIEDARLSAPNFSASGYENAIRSEFRKLAKNSEKMALFSITEQKAIEEIAKGGPLLNLLRNLGRAAPVGGLMQTLHIGGAASTAGATLPFTVAASLARVGARQMQKNNARLIEAIVKHGRLPPQIRKNSALVPALLGATSAAQ